MIKSSLAPKVTTPAMHFKSEVNMEQIYAGAWKWRNGSGAAIFIINTAKEEGEYTLSFNNDEYALDREKLRSLGFVINSDGQATLSGSILPESIISIEV